MPSPNQNPLELSQELADNSIEVVPDQQNPGSYFIRARTPTFQSSLTDADLVGGAGVVNVQHGLNFRRVYVLVTNDTDDDVRPDGVRRIDANNARIDLSSFYPLGNGITWNVTIFGGYR